MNIEIFSFLCLIVGGIVSFTLLAIVMTRPQRIYKD
jgi:hypothetical protein